MQCSSSLPIANGQPSACTAGYWRPCGMILKAFIGHGCFARQWNRNCSHYCTADLAGDRPMLMHDHYFMYFVIATVLAVDVVAFILYWRSKP